MNEIVMQKISYGLFVLTARDGDKDNGCILNTVAQVAYMPDRMIIAVNKKNYTHDMILKTGEFNVSILSQEAKFDVFKQFGFQSGRDVNKFEGVSFKRAENGIAYLEENCNAYITAKVLQTIDVSSHTLFIADPTGGALLSEVPSLTYQYYFDHIKPKPEKKEEKKTGWICKICGYIYEGEELPEDYICPICKHPASDFERLS
jgi:flavin reductase (DIM6/NTAB) family NADH-FMN oxidoreductase RutF/rubredoxin